MILKSYLFCQNQNDYVQYPNDHTASFLKPLCGQQKAKHQVVVYRDGGLMYYCYLYDTGENEIIGMCFATGLLCTHPKLLYDTFVECFSCFAKRGIIFNFNKNGEIKCVTDFTQNIGEIEELFRWFKGQEGSSITWEALPPEDHTIVKGASVFFNFKEDNPDAIVEATRHYTYVFITMHNPIPTSYGQTIKRLNSEKKKLTNEKEELVNQIEIVNKQKKQYKLVIGLIIILLLGALIFIAIVNDKNKEIQNQLATIQTNKETISLQCDTILTQKQTIHKQNHTISILNNIIENWESKYSSLESDYSSITSIYPLKITNIEIGNVYSSGSIETDYYNRRVRLSPNLN